MKIIKEGTPPDTVYVGECEHCGCKLECTRDETVMGAWRYAECPTPSCGALVQVRRKR